MVSGKKCGGCKVLGTLVVLGAINWGLVGAFNLDLVARFLGEMTVVSRVVYGLIGVAGVMALICCIKGCPKCCSADSKG